MAIGFPAGITSQYIEANAQTKPASLRSALEQCEDFYRWLATLPYLFGNSSRVVIGPLGA